MGVNMTELPLATLAKNLGNLESLRIQFPAQLKSLGPIDEVKFHSLKFFEIGSDFNLLSHLQQPISHFIEKCLPTLRCLGMGRTYDMEINNAVLLRGIPVSCDSYSMEFDQFCQTANPCLKQITNLCIKIWHLEPFFRHLSYLSANFSLKILNINLVIDKKFDDVKILVSSIMEVVKRNQQLEILSVRFTDRSRNFRKHERELCDKILTSESICDMIHRCAVLKLLIVGNKCKIRKLTLTGSNIQLINQLDDLYGFTLSTDVNL